MDRLDRTFRPTGRCPLAFALVLVGLACQPDERSGAAPKPSNAASAAAALSPSALQIAPDQLSRIELLTRSRHSKARRVVIEKSKHGWQITSPVKYRANQTALESMVAVMAEIEIVSSAAGDQQAARKHGVDRAQGVEVKAWAGDRLQSHFIVGRSAAETTYVKLVDDPRVLTVRGRCRPIFGKELNELRHPIITKFDLKDIVAVSYSNAFGGLQLVPDPTELGKFVPQGAVIRNFNRDRASQQVSVLAHLYAKGFVDPPHDAHATGLFDDDTPRATLSVRQADGVKEVHVWVGQRTRDRLHLRTSEGEQIYLVSAHLETSLIARRSHLARSDQMMRQLKAQRKKASGAREGQRPHTHGHSPSPRSQVPPELMSALRVLARQQREDR